ncbi:MAG: DUF1592 domain-containing protein [Verrucomicrobiota bacterium]
MRFLSISRLILVSACLLAQPSHAAPPSAVMPEKYFEFFDRYCLDCHDSATEKGEVNLEDLSFDLGTIPSAELWQKVLNTLNSGEMPPEDKKQPTPEHKTEFLDALSHKLVNARKILTDSGGLITMRRLNRREYQNTMKQLLDVHVDAEDLPDDANSDGFDTAGASLFFSSDQFEQYLAVARRALEDAINTGPKPETKRVRTQAEIDGNKRVQNFHDNLLDSHTRAEAWRKSNKPPTAFGFIDKDRVAFEDGNYRKWWPGTDRYLKDPLSTKGALLYTWFQGAQTARADIPSKAPPGKYILRARVGAIGDQPSHRRFLELGHPAADGRSGELSLIDCQRVTGTTDDPQIIEVPVTISRSGERDFAFRERGPNTRDAARYSFVTGSRENEAGPEPALWIDWVEWEGPFVEKWPPTSHRKIFFKGPDAEKNDEYAREIIYRFARRAFRITNPSKSFVDKLMALYQLERKNGKSFEQALIEPLAVVLASPNFLYLNEPATDDEKRELTDLELAVRLAYFLWSAPPDAELYDLARRGKLKNPAVLKRQTNRMLDDPRTANFISGFAHQWLHMERLDFFQFNYRHFWEFDESVKHAAREEIYQTLRVLLNNNLPVGKLLKSDFVVINDLLADYYGIEGIGGSRFRKVELDEDSPRGGLLATLSSSSLSRSSTACWIGATSSSRSSLWCLWHSSRAPIPSTWKHPATCRCCS